MDLAKPLSVDTLDSILVTVTTDSNSVTFYIVDEDGEHYENWLI